MPYKENNHRVQQLFAMKSNIKLKLLIPLAGIVLAAISCQSGYARPASGVDLSTLAPHIISISSKISDDAGVEHAALPKRHDAPSDSRSSPNDNDADSTPDTPHIN